MGLLDGHVAIVTGASKGLGVGIANALAKEGAAVTVIARNLNDVQKTAAAIEGFGARALALKCDVGDQNQVDAVVQKTIETFGRVDILVNNAQSMPATTNTKSWTRPLEEWTGPEMHESWQSGPMGSFYFMVACLPHMKERGGRIINFCAAAGHGRFDGLVGYSMAKEAIRTLTKCAAREWGKYGINVNLISPIALSAAMEENLPTQESRDALLDQVGCVIRRIGHPEHDVGRTVVFLCGLDSRPITGCTLSVDGGAAML